ncbi:hypothetical protein G9A89_008266 [Geosiphon pyriformis]|nr:hypothetical protein G9A89_008266 [Geosiphon pyriformis]
MENKEIKRDCLETHDCNECESCQEGILNEWNKCAACQLIFLKKHYKNFSSGNEVVDEIIKNPTYTLPDENSNKYHDNLNYYEWIPWEILLKINEIAKGGFGIIYKAILIDGLIDIESIKHHGSMEYKTRGKGYVAIKIIKMNSSEVFKELNIQRTIYINTGGYSSKCISSIWGITQNPETLEYGIVMEFAQGGDMRKHLSTNFQLMNWLDKLGIARDIAYGLSNIHSSGMVHRDLHSGNILQLKGYEVNIGDLGLCRQVNNEATTTTTTTDTTTATATEKKKEIFGVIPYIPPEVLRGEKFTMAGDIYSYGMLLWEIATGKPPFHDRSHDHFLVMDILYNGLRPKITFPLIPPSIAEIIVKCWDVNPENRPNAREIYEMLMKEPVSTSELSESDKHAQEMAEGDDSTTTTTAKTPLHPGAVYTSRLLTLQIIQETKELVYLPEDLSTLTL